MSAIPGVAPMTILISALCDAATDYGGKLNILGTFDTIFSRELPARHPNCSIALRVLFAREEEGLHRLMLNFVDADGGAIMTPIELPVQVTVPDEVDSISRNIVINIQQLRFTEPGQYAIDIAFDGMHRASIPLRVSKIERPSENSSGGEPEDGGVPLG